MAFENITLMPSHSHAPPPPPHTHHADNNESKSKSLLDPGFCHSRVDKNPLSGNKDTIDLF